MNSDKLAMNGCNISQIERSQYLLILDYNIIIPIKKTQFENIQITIEIFVGKNIVFNECNFIPKLKNKCSLVESTIKSILFESCFIDLNNIHFNNNTLKMNNCFVFYDSAINLSDYGKNNQKVTLLKLVSNIYFSTHYCPTEVVTETKFKFNKDEGYVALFTMAALKIVLTGVLKCVGSK